MAELTTKARKAIPKSKFALPGERKYPIENKAHAANAKARASQMEAKGKLSASAKAEIDRKADRVLGEKGGKPSGDHARAVKVKGKRYVTGGEIKKPRDT